MNNHISTKEAMAEQSEAHVKSAVRKFYIKMIPITVIMLLINQIDRTNLGFVQDALRVDLGISAAAFGFGAGLFFIGYALFEVPSNLYLKKLGAKIWLTRIMISWGLVTFLMGFTHGEKSFYILRFLLGVTEAGFFPGVIYYYSIWLPDRYRGKAMAIFLSAASMAYIVTGPISGALLEMHGFFNIAGWRWMFYVEGGVSILIGIVCVFFLVSHINNAQWLTSTEKIALNVAVKADEEKRSSGNRKDVSFLKLLFQPTLLKLCAIYFVSVMTGYTVAFWLPGILRQIPNINNFQVGLLSAIPWIFSVIAMYVLAKITDNIGYKKYFVAGAMILMAIGGFLATKGSPWFALFALTLSAIGYKSCNSVFWAMTSVTLNVKILAAGIALINTIGNLGGFVAPTVFGIIKDQTGSLEGGLIGLSLCSIIGFIIVLTLKIDNRV